MLIFIRRYEKNIIFRLSKVFNSTSTSNQTDTETNTKEFRVLELIPRKNKINKVQRQDHSLPSRCDKMSFDQDWPSVWSGARSFNPYVVPLPLHQGYVKGKKIPPGKYGNAELLKIPNFLHLTPPAIKRHCEVLKQFCTSWPKELDTDEECNRHFPLDIITSDYCYSSPTIREPLARIVSLKVNLNSLILDSHAKDKLLRLVGNKYNPETNIITITADRCPTRKQNLEYIEYLLVALFHESWHIEAWEAEKSEADMEYYDWDKSKSRQNLIALHSWPESSTDVDIETIPSGVEYKVAVSELINQGEDQYALNKYKEAVKNILHLKCINRN
ncbi:28S ribosomal protein S35, mitochondrial [Vespa velutina]|uniref:28S ribosomal protein S35, mitochondrial n=1 Tax=Vespa velutina TaxID=202808 RepID=UPI001FB3E572|nr:28S ribosomal protein S35, mitochondrial [Vespa velutina]